MDNVQIGDEVKDRVSGFTGIAVARTEWLNGCIRFSVQPRTLDKDGRLPSTEGFDVEQLEIVTKQAVAPKPPERRTNGPMPEPRRR